MATGNTLGVLLSEKSQKLLRFEQSAVQSATDCFFL